MTAPARLGPDCVVLGALAGETVLRSVSTREMCSSDVPGGVSIRR